MFKALGDPTRLRIFEYLCSCHPEVVVDDGGSVRSIIGPTVGAVCCHLNGEEAGRSNVSFHLKELRLAGLISMEKRGKHIVCAATKDAVIGLQDYFKFVECACDGKALEATL